jgi:hypothetical protein
VVITGATEKSAPLGEVPIGIPPVGAVYHKMVLPGAVALRVVVAPSQITLGEAVTGDGEGHWAYVFFKQNSRPTNSKVLFMTFDF